MIIEGAIETDESRQIAALLVTLVDIGARQLLVDLARVDICDPEFPDFLDGLRRRLVSLGGWMVVDGPPTTLDDDSLTLDDLFTIYTRVAGPQLPLGGRSGDVLLGPWAQVPNTSVPQGRPRRGTVVSRPIRIDPSLPSEATNRVQRREILPLFR